MRASVSIWLKSKKLLSEKMDEISSKYRGKLVAIYDGRIVAVSDDLEKIMAELRSKGMDPKYTLIEYIPDEELILII